MSHVVEIPSYQDNLEALIRDLGEMLPQDKLAVFNADAAQLPISKSYSTTPAS